MKFLTVEALQYELLIVMQLHQFFQGIFGLKAVKNLFIKLYLPVFPGITSTKDGVPCKVFRSNVPLKNNFGPLLLQPIVAFGEQT